MKINLDIAKASIIISYEYRLDILRVIISERLREYDTTEKTYAGLNISKSKYFRIKKLIKSLSDVNSGMMMSYNIEKNSSIENVNLLMLNIIASLLYNKKIMAIKLKNVNPTATYFEVTNKNKKENKAYVSVPDFVRILDISYKEAVRIKKDMLLYKIINVKHKFGIDGTRYKDLITFNINTTLFYTEDLLKDIINKTIYIHSSEDCYNEVSADEDVDVKQPSGVDNFFSLN